MLIFPLLSVTLIIIYNMNEEVVEAEKVEEGEDYGVEDNRDEDGAEENFIDGEDS